MNLDNRVETLEHEFKILKNEIEGTLLEIQNQVLIHYYPALRADDSTPPQEIRMTPPGRAKGAKEAPAVATPKGSALGLGADGPQLKEVSLSNLSRIQPQVALPLLDEEQFSPDDGTLGATALSHLAKWVNDAVEQVGKAQAVEIIESSADAANCTATVRAVLHQFIDLSTEDAPPPNVDTKSLMHLLLKLNKVFDQVARLEAQIPDQQSRH